MNRFKRLSFNKNSINTKAGLLLACILIFFVIVFSIATVIILEKMKYDYEISESEALISSEAGNISINLETYKDLSRLIMLNEKVVDFLRADGVDAGLINDAKYGVMDVMNVTTHLDSVYIFRRDEEFMSTGRGAYNVDLRRMHSEEWQRDILGKKGGALIYVNANGAIKKNNGKPIITVARAIYDIYSQKQTGILIMNFSTDMLSGMTSSKDNSRLCVVSTSGEYLAGDEELVEYFSPVKSTDGIVHAIEKSENGRVMISKYRIPGTPMMVLCYTESHFSVLPYEVMYALILLFVTISIGTFLAVNYITRDVTRPIMQLSEAMERTQKTGWLEKMDVRMPQNEIGDLAENYNSMIEHLNALFTELIEKEKSVQRAEMRVLQEQIKPHFLYNSMETISCMALNDGAEDVHQALETLGSFYRNFLSKGDREIPLSREVNIIKDYLAIQKLRYGDILKDVYEIDSEVLDWPVPKLILQPLVENSIYHGIRPLGEEGSILIRAYSMDGALHLVVRDSGLGMTSEQIDKLLSVESHPETGENEEGGRPLSGFGLKGTIERIRYYCGRNDVVMITSEPGEYTEIEMILPGK